MYGEKTKMLLFRLGFSRVLFMFSVEIFINCSQKLCQILETIKFIIPKNF